MIELFWISMAVILYTYLGYPLIVFGISLFYKQPTIRKYLWPQVSVIISVYNEEKNIENKLKSLMELDYPETNLEIIIGLDGCTDNSEEAIKKFTSGYKYPVSYHKREKREGKPSMLNLLIPFAKGELIIFTDARQKIDPNAAKELVKYFSDPKVGSVSGELIFEKEDSQTGSGVGIYWQYEKFIRTAESKIGSMLGATGALYAIRKELFPKLPKNLILDDVYVPMSIVQRGYRAIFDKKAIIIDKFSKDSKAEFKRKIRTLAGNFQLFVYAKWLFNPFSSYVTWEFFSHKFLRVILPFFLALNLISNIYLWNNGHFYKIFLSLQILFYFAAFLGTFIKSKSKLIDIPYMFFVMNLAAVVGLLRFIVGKETAVWKKTS